MPGHRLPPHMACQTSYYLEDPLHLYCQPVGEDRADNVFVTYDRLGKVIVDTDILNPQETAGDLLLAWGNPVGYQQQALGRYLYWPGRYVYIGGLEFSPDAKVGFIVYDDTATAHDAWRGFTN